MIAYIRQNRDTLVIFLLGIICTITLATMVLYSDYETVKARFKMQATELIDALQYDIDKEIQKLRILAGFIETEQTLSPELLENVTHAHLNENYKIIYIAWISYEGNTENESRYRFQYIEPMIANEYRLGKLIENEHLKRIMWHAAQVDEITGTNFVSASEESEDYTIILVKPVYHADNRIRGFVVINYMMPEFVQTEHMQNKLALYDLSIKIHELQKSNHKKQLAAFGEMHEQGLIDTSTISFADKLLSISVEKSNLLDEVDYKAPFIFLVLGFSLTAFIIYAVTLSKRARRAAELLAEEKKHALVIKQKELERSVISGQSKSDFISHISHELRTPIHAVLNYTHFSKKYLSEHKLDDLQRALENILSSSEKLNLLMENIVDFTHIQENDLQLVYTSCRIDLLIKECHSVLAFRLEERHQTVHGLDALPVVAAVCDRHKIFTVLSNLLLNASNFSPTHSEIDIELVADDSLKMVSITIADTGPGVSEEELENIFHNFQKLEQENFSGGIGIGLGVCREIVESHHGRIFAENRPNSGLKVTVLLPKTGMQATVMK